MRNLSKMEEAFNAMNMVSTTAGEAVQNLPRIRIAQFSRDGVEISLDLFRSSTEWKFVHLTIEARTS